MIRCCIFDLDGTLLNTLDALTYTTNLTLKEFGYGPVGEEQVKQFVGDGYRMQVKRALQYCGDEKLTHYEEALSVYMKLFAEHCLYHVRPYDGIRELLETLKKQGFEKTEDIKAYSAHPEHVKVADTYVRPFVTERACLDYQD